MNKIRGIKDGDLCIKTFRSDFAEFIFPTWTHRSGKSMNYAQFISHVISPEKIQYI